MSKLVLVFPTEESRSHWMTPRMLKRAGLGDQKFDTLVADDTILQKLNNGRWTTAVLFGEGALNAVLNKFDILRWFNRTLEVYLKDRKVVCVPCLEPMHLLPYTVPSEDEKHKGMRHPPRYQGAVGICLRRAVELSEKGWPGRTEVDYLQDPTPSRFKEWVNEFEKAVQEGTVQFLSWDIETPYKLSEDDEDEFEEEKRRMDKTILRISFSYKSHTAVSIPWAAEYLEDIKRLLAFSGRHVGWNAVAFDVPVVRANGIEVGGLMLDGMDAWHLLQSDLDKGLEHVTSFTSDLLPWKHLNDTMPALYSCIDADAALRNVLWIEQRLKEQDMWERFLKEMEVMEILNRAGEHGNNVDEPFRLEMKAELEALLFEKVLAVQNTIPEKFKRRKFMVRLPKGADPADYGTFVLQKEVNCCSFCGKERVNIRHKCLDEKWEKVKVMKEKEVYYHLRPFEGITELAPLLKKLQQNGFNPCSAHQMKLYMKAHRHPVGTNHKTKKETADVKHLKKLKAKYGDKHPIYAATLEIRLIQKALSTYVNGLEPDEKGLIHTSYVNSPSTWRLGSRNINVQNLGKRADNPHAKKARKIIIPRPGHVFVQADSAAIEAVMVGHFMGDENYIELARKGVHGYVTGKFLGEKFTPKTYTVEDNDRIKHNHKALYDQFKQVNHGCLTGDHEVLTKGGWVRFDQYDFKQPVAQWHPDSKLVSFVAPLDYVNKEVTEPLVQLSGRVNCLATRDHRWPVNTSQNNVKEYTTATLPKANSIPLAGVRLQGKVVDEQTIRRIAAVQADGTIRGLFHLRKPHKIQAIVELGGQPTGTAETWKLPLPEFGLTAAKHFDVKELLTWDFQSRKRLLQELPMWDGDRKRTYRTADRQNVDAILAVAAITGMAPTVRFRQATPSSFGQRGYWEISFSWVKGNVKASLESIERTEVEFSGRIYCVTTQTGYFLCRHGDSVFVTGNTNFGMGPYLMHMNDPEKFPHVKDAERIQDFIFSELPGLPRWHYQLRLDAQKTGYLQNPWGLRHYFYDVFNWKYDDDKRLVLDSEGNPQMKLGKDSKRVIAFKPQSSAGFFMRDNIHILGRTNLASYLPAIVSIHDGYTVEVPDEEHWIDYARQTLGEILTRPIKEMNGLRIGCEIEIMRKNFLESEVLEVRG